MFNVRDEELLVHSEQFNFRPTIALNMSTKKSTEVKNLRTILTEDGKCDRPERRLD